MVDARRDGRPLLAVYLDHVKTRLHIVRMTLQPFLSRRDDARLLCRRYMLTRRCKAGIPACLDLDEYNIFPILRDNVDFSKAGAEIRI